MLAPMCITDVTPRVHLYYTGGSRANTGTGAMFLDPDSDIDSHWGIFPQYFQTKVHAIER